MSKAKSQTLFRRASGGAPARACGRAWSPSGHRQGLVKGISDFDLDDLIQDGQNDAQVLVHLLVHQVINQLARHT